MYYFAVGRLSAAWFLRSSQRGEVSQSPRRGSSGFSAKKPYLSYLCKGQTKIATTSSVLKAFGKIYSTNRTIKPSGLNKYELRKVGKSAGQKTKVNTPAKTKWERGKPLSGSRNAKLINTMKILTQPLEKSVHT